jgi:predicted TIM-barrel fold metal-dependent hydrolase
MAARTYVSGTRPIDFRHDGVIDCHVHVGKWYFDTEGDGTLGWIRRLNKQFGISRSVVMITVPGDTDGGKANRQLLDSIGDDREFLFFFWVDPRVHTIADVESITTRLHGLKLHPSHTGTRVNSKKMEPFLEWSERNRKPLLVHCGRWQEYSSYRFAIETAKEHTFPVILAHMGGPAYELKVQTLDMLRKAKVDNIFLDTSTCFQPHLIRQAVEVVGEKNVLFGSDYPLYHPAPSMQVILLAGLPNDITAGILGDNLASLLNLWRETP